MSWGPQPRGFCPGPGRDAGRRAFFASARPNLRSSLARNTTSWSARSATSPHGRGWRAHRIPFLATGPAGRSGRGGQADVDRRVGDQRDGGGGGVARAAMPDRGGIAPGVGAGSRACSCPSAACRGCGARFRRAQARAHRGLRDPGAARLARAGRHDHLALAMGLGLRAARSCTRPATSCTGADGRSPMHRPSTWA